MPCRRLNYEALRALSWVTPRRRPGTFPDIRHFSDRSVPARLRGASQSYTHSKVFRPVALPETSQTRGVASISRQNQHDAELGIDAEDQELDIDDTGLPNLAELHTFEALLLREFEDELRQAAKEEGLELEAMLDTTSGPETETRTIGDAKTMPELSEIGGEEGETFADEVLALYKFDSVHAAQNAVLSVLKNKHYPAHELLFTFFGAAQHPDYLHTLTGEVLDEILYAIRPERLLEPYRSMSSNLSTSSLQFFKLRGFDEMATICSEVLELLVVQLEYSKLKPQTWVLETLLDLARARGDAVRAKIIFSRLKELSDHNLSLQSYNHMLEAHCWSGVYSTDYDSERRRLRVFPIRQEARDIQTEAPEFPARHHNLKYRTGSGGIKDEALTLFKQLQDQGLTPDAASFTNLMIAMAREGGTDDIKWVLYNVWDVDCDKVMTGQEDAPVLLNKLERESPLYPTGTTLTAIIHGFGSNSDLASAMRVAHFFSEKYNIEFTEQHWTELLEWTYVLSSNRYDGSKKYKHTYNRQQRIGQVPAKSTADLWQIMTSPPHSIAPSIPLLNLMIRAEFRRRCLRNAAQLMLDAEALARQSAKRWRMTRPENNDIPFIQHPAAYEHFRDFNIVQQAFRLFLGQSHVGGRSTNLRKSLSGYFTRVIPNVIARFERYTIPSGNAYTIPSGRVQFHAGAPSKTPGVSYSVSERTESGFAIRQTRLSDPIPFQSGNTRQVRLETRHIKRGFRGRNPDWVPQFFEADDVADWEHP